MQALIQDTIAWIKTHPARTPSLMMTADEYAYYQASIKKLLPQLPIVPSVPDDHKAKLQARLWLQPYMSCSVLLIGFEESVAAREFLENVVRAVHDKIAPAKWVDGNWIEQERAWDLLFTSTQLKSVISSPYTQWKDKELAIHYRAASNTLGGRPVLMVEPATVYLHNPEQKRQLWKALHMHLSSLMSPSPNR